MRSRQPKARGARSRANELVAVTPAVLAEFFASPAVRATADGKRKASISVNLTLSAHRGFWSWCHASGLVAANPARLLRRAITTPPSPKSIDERGLERLRGLLRESPTAAGWRDHALVHLLLATGIRIGSALALDAEDVDLDAGTIRLRRAKGDREEVVYLARDVREHLGAFLPATGPVFRGPGGERLSQRQAQKRITAWLERAGIQHATVHSLRHAFATRLLARTGDLFLVKEAMRHRSIESTVVYLKLVDGRLRAALDSLTPIAAAGGLR